MCGSAKTIYISITHTQLNFNDNKNGWEEGREREGENRVGGEVKSKGVVKSTTAYCW